MEAANPQPRSALIRPGEITSRPPPSSTCRSATSATTCTVPGTASGPLPAPPPTPFATETPNQLLTITEAAEIAGASVATLRYWRHLGIGPLSFRIGRHVVYRADDLHAWINA